LGVAGALAATEIAVLALRPRSGIIDPLPVDSRSYFSEAEIGRARSFRRPQLALMAAGMLIEGGALRALTRRPPRRLPRRLPRAARRPLPIAAAAGARTSLVLGAATLPLSAVARRRAIRVGLTTDTWTHWAADVAKSSAIGALAAGGAAALWAGLVARWRDRWWVPGSALAVLTGGALTYAGPLLLDPLFNRFSVVPDGPLRDDVLELARRAGVTVGEVFEADASRRTTAANAYVTGLGPSRRVVLHDTLLQNFSRDETRLVIAHELAHVHHRDIARGLLFLALTAPAGLYAVARLTDRLAGGAGDDGPGPSAVPALALSLAIVGGPVGLLSRRLSRLVEARADAFALRITDAPEAGVSFMQRIAVRNLADPDPPAWLRSLLATHPSTVQRIGIAKAYAQTRA
jgi:STE24 endopeptidase